MEKLRQRGGVEDEVEDEPVKAPEPEEAKPTATRKPYVMTEARKRAIEKMKEGNKARLEAYHKLKEDNPEAKKEFHMGRPLKEGAKRKREKPIYKEVLEKIEPAEEEEENEPEPLPNPKEKIVVEPDPEPEIIVKKPKEKKKKIIVVEESDSSSSEEEVIVRKKNPKRQIKELRNEVENLKKSLYVPEREVDLKTAEMMKILLGGRRR